MNKFALLRNSRGRDYPNLVQMAKRCIAAGAHGITIHPRPDQRHAKYSDVAELSKLLQQHPSIELNIEGYPIPQFLEGVKAAQPHQCTLVPDDPNQLTSDHGWNLHKHCDLLAPILQELQAHEIRVSLFMDPDPASIPLAKEIGADRIELYTESYAQAFGTPHQEEVRSKYQKTAAKAQKVGLGVNAGHDLDLQNLGYFLKIPQILEVSIGHALVVESFDQGLESTLQTYLQIIAEAGSS